MNRNYFGIFVLFLVIASIGCQDNSSQEEFERRAFSTPENFTKTDANGNILINDPDDWEIGPLFQGLVEINAVPYANPSIGLRFNLEILVTGLEAVSGLEIYARDPFGRPFIIYNDNRRPLPHGLVDIFIEPSWLAPSRVYSEAIGLNRIFIYDDRGSLITYGDLKVE